jgi:hypothetical protein
MLYIENYLLKIVVESIGEGIMILNCGWWEECGMMVIEFEIGKLHPVKS